MSINRVVQDNNNVIPANIFACAGPRAVQSRGCGNKIHKLNKVTGLGMAGAVGARRSASNATLGVHMTRSSHDVAQ
jgi:hypothetical protein